MELDWIRHRRWRLRDADYVRMVYKKTSWYTFIGPMVIGGIIADASAEHLASLRKFAALLGVAFQAQDDVLNLIGQGKAYGKEIAGDLWEGKHTLIVMHMMRNATEADRRRARRILGKPRPAPPRSRPHSPDRNGRPPRAWKALLADLRDRGDLTETGRRALNKAVRAGLVSAGDGFKTLEDIAFLRRLIERHGSVEHTREVARRFARKAQAILAHADWLVPSVHRDFLQELVGFVVDRER